MKIKKILSLSLAAVLALSLTACGGKKEATEVKVGVVGSNNEQWETVNKLLEKDNGSVRTVQIEGLTAVGPYAGGMVQTAEEESLTPEYVKELLGVLEGQGMLESCTQLDCTAAASMTLHYGVYRLKLPRDGSYDYHIQLAQAALSEGLKSGVIQEGQSGLLDLTVMDGKAHWRPDRQ